jgi:hypothetical protein
MIGTTGEFADAFPRLPEAASEAIASRPTQACRVVERQSVSRRAKATIAKEGALVDLRSSSVLGQARAA